MVCVPIEVIATSDLQRDKILALQEGHFLDLKAKDIKPSKLSKAISAFANADGGELYVGIYTRVSATRQRQAIQALEAGNRA